MTADAEPAPQGITKEEIALYDRQIRLWGLEAQNRMRNSNILLINLSSVGVEIAKNLMLGGIGSFTVVDESKILSQDLKGNFFITADQVGQYKVDAAREKIQDLNPRVKLNTVHSSWEKIIETQDETWIKQFTVIIATGLNKASLLKLNELTRAAEIPLYATSCHGLYGYIFVDLISHDSTIKKPKGSVSKKVGDKMSNVSEYISVTEVTESDDIVMEHCIVRNNYVSFAELYTGHRLKETFTTPKKLKRISNALPLLFALLEYPEYNGIEIEKIQLEIEIEALKEKAHSVCDQLGMPRELVSEDILSKLHQQAFTEFHPVSSIVGGALSQDVINTLGKRESPINNVLVFDGPKSEMPIYII